jgi:DNA-binding transcriptional LysR family regulator
MDARFIDLLPDLALFVAIGEADSLSGASRATGVPVARLSRRLAALEKTLGVRLVERTPRRFQLTAEGEAYLARLSPAVGAMADAYGATAEEGREPGGTLRLAASADFGAMFLAPLVAEFATLHPKVRFDIDLSPRRVDLGAERFDAAIRVGPLPDSPLTSRRFATVPSALYAAPAYLQACGRPHHPSDLARHRCLPLPHMKGAALLRRGEETCRVAMPGPVKVNNLLMLRCLCGEGLGIAALNPVIAAEGGAHCPVERVLADWELEPAVFYFLTPGRLIPARTRAFFDFARRRLDAQGY